MRIYNGKNANINVPLPNGERLSIDGKSISKDFMPSVEFLNMIKTSFDYNEIALIVSGIIEMNLCSSVSSIAGFVANSVGEAVERFSPKPVITETKNPETESIQPVKNPELITPEKEIKKEKEIEELEKTQEKEKKKKDKSK